MRRDTWRTLARSGWAWALLPLTLLVVVVGLLVASVLVPYQPFVLRDYQVVPDVVCSGGDVTALVTRKFEDRFDFLKLSEQWVTVEVPGLDPGLPVGVGAAGVLPSEALDPGEFDTVPSPLLNEAPVRPGVYRVRIVAQFQGTRWGFVPAIGDEVFTSNLVTVVPCPDGPPPAPREDNP